MSKYNVVLISHQEEEKYFICKIPSFFSQKGSGLLKAIIEFKSKNGENPYKKFSQFVSDKDINELFVIRGNKEFSAIEAEEEIYKNLIKLKDKHGDDCILNDIIINPERVKCNCGMFIRKQFLQAHLDKYCKMKCLDIDIDF